MSNYDRSHRVVEIVAITSHVALSAVLVVRFAMAQPSALEVIAAAALLLPAMLGADFVSAVVHFAADRFGDTSTPIFGRNLIRSFREHHDDPKAMTHHDFVTIAGDTCLLSVPLLALMTWLVPASSTANRLFILFMVLFLSCVFMISQVHKWSHMDEKAPALMLKLQRWGLLLDPVHHEKHHTAPHDSTYATFTGWVNPFLDRAGFFPAFEATARSIWNAPRPEDAPTTDAPDPAAPEQPVRP